MTETSVVPSRDLVAASPDHFVHFYDDDADLVGNVARYVRHGIEAGCGGVVICTPEHRAALEASWRASGFDASPRRARGQLLVLDAAQTLGKLMTKDGPDAALFDMTVGATMRDLVARWGQVVAFGEMVALLWVKGQPRHAVELENLWNELCAAEPFALYCAYPMGACGVSDATGHFRDVCDAHSHVMPAAPVFGAGPDEAQQLRLLAELRQKAAALDSELKLRQQAEQRLLQREAELSDFLENGVVGLHRVGPDGTILWANRAELAMLGYAPNEYIGHPIAKFHADRKLVDRMMDALSSGQQLKDQPAKMICRDGSIRHVLVNSNAQMEAGRFVATRCFTRDVTDRWLAQEALRERGAVLHLALQGARSGYWIVDLDAGTVRCSHEIAGLFGEPGAFEGPFDDFLALMHADDREAFRAAFDAAVAGQRMLSCDFRLRPGQGGERWFEARGEALLETEGAARRFYGICTDVTARRHQERMLEHYAAVIDSAQDAVITTSLDGTILTWNPAATRLLGFPPQDIVGRSIRTLVPAQLQPEEDVLFERMRRGETIERYATQRLASDGSQRHVVLTLSPVRGRDGQIVAASSIVAA